jgi:hypothetical protein
MSVLGTICDVGGGICLAGGAVLLMNLGYLSLTTRLAPGKVTGWTEEQDGRIVRYRAQLVYQGPGGAEQAAIATSLSFDSDRDANPPGSKVRVRYYKGVPESANIADGFWTSWGAGLIGVAIGIAAFALGTLLH